MNIKMNIPDLKSLDDKCCICGHELDLTALHSFDRDIGRPKHAKCDDLTTNHPDIQATAKKERGGPIKRQTKGYNEQR